MANDRVQHDAPRMEFHIARTARERYQFDQALFGLNGNVILANFHAARVFAQKINQKRDLERFPEQAVRAGQINAMGLLDEILHFVTALFNTQAASGALARALAHLDATCGEDAVDATLRRFTEEFPPQAVYRHTMTPDAYLASDTDGTPNRQLALEELLLLWLANRNPAFAPFMELFNDTALARDTAYMQVIKQLTAFFTTEPCFGPDHQHLVEMLRSPAVVHPHSLAAQLEYVLTRWGALLGKYRFRLLSSLDLIQEEEKAIFSGPGPSLVYDYSTLGEEPERFSTDKDWMPKVVLLAKNTYVWLDQLSRQYQRNIDRLDQIPDEELDTLAQRGFTGLWLIGLWERSPASQRIKQWCGNPEAVSSAYSVYAYDPAGDLGGEEALNNLRERAWQRGIRLASDMVPNHMGIDSPWVIEHPDWFVALDYSPFPVYTFTGVSLSPDPRVGIYLEDRYFSREDAAVVFKRVDFATGDTKFIYHGNDGTSMPWNDTAQLNYLIPAVREAVLQTILHVACNFPIIRFDAAMTLAKKHYQRLWFPEPGSGGAIPSRAEHGMTRPQFNAVFPEEFWREVVDRVAREVPDTLLLAEAFWLMEGYFVRTLGMHRVYNSAFMNMLRDEDNAKYRSVMKNTMEFDLEILKRFVNFMNNPDERTAVDQFGSGDKYIGVCALMCTLPGLPMFGHGQVEGFTEKYGMEYRRAYLDEHPDGWLVERHEREIFPLLHKRYIFAEARDFLIYDFFSPEGFVNEDVFAYSNRSGDERGLVLYHNKFADTRGWIRNSVGYAVKGAGGEKVIQQRTLADGLALHNDDAYYTVCRDSLTGLEYIRNSKELCERGLYVELHAYQCHVFLDFREVPDNAEHHYRHLCAYLNGRGVPSIEEAMRELFLQPVHQPFKELVNAGMFRYLHDAVVTKPGRQPAAAPLDEVETKAQRLFREVRQFTGGSGDEVAFARELRDLLAALLRLPALAPREPLTALADDLQLWGTLFGWLAVHALGTTMNADDAAGYSRSWLDEWQLGRLLAGALRDFGLDDNAAGRAVTAVALLTMYGDWYADMDEPHAASRVLAAWLQDAEVQRFLHVNRHNEVLWFNHEAFQQFLHLMWLVAAARVTAETDRPTETVNRDLAAIDTVITTLSAAEAASGYRLDYLLDAVEEPAPA